MRCNQSPARPVTEQKGKGDTQNRTEPSHHPPSASYERMMNVLDHCTASPSHLISVDVDICSTKSGQTLPYTPLPLQTQETPLPKRKGQRAEPNRQRQKLL